MRASYCATHLTVQAMGAICQTDGFPRAEDTANSGSQAKSRTGQSCNAGCGTRSTLSYEQVTYNYTEPQ